MFINKIKENKQYLHIFILCVFSSTLKIEEIKHTKLLRQQNHSVWFLMLQICHSH